MSGDTRIAETGKRGWRDMSTAPLHGTMMILRVRSPAPDGAGLAGHLWTGVWFSGGHWTSYEEIVRRRPKPSPPVHRQVEDT